MKRFEKLTELTAKQQRAIAALVAEPTTHAAAQKSGVSETTLWRWLQEEDFSEAYQAAKSQLLESTLVALQSASVEAVITLKEVMTDTTAQPSARVSAARAVLDTALKAREVLEVEERLAYLEKYLDLKNKGERKTA